MLGRSSSAGVTTSVDVDYGQVDDALKAARTEIRTQAKKGMATAADFAVAPRVRSAAALTMPPISTAALTTKANMREAYVTTRGPRVADRITGLLEFGGTVTTVIEPKKQGRTGLPIGGSGSDIIRYSVHGPRHYTGKRVLRTAVASSVDEFETILLRYVIDAFDPIPHVP